MKLSDLRGLDGDLARQTKKTRKSGGASKALRMAKKRPEGGQGTRRDGYCFTGDIKPAWWLKNKKWGWKPPKE